MENQKKIWGIILLVLLASLAAGICVIIFHYTFTYKLELEQIKSEIFNLSTSSSLITSSYSSPIIEFNSICENHVESTCVNDTLQQQYDLWISNNATLIVNRHDRPGFRFDLCIFLIFLILFFFTPIIIMTYHFFFIKV